MLSSLGRLRLVAMAGLACATVGGLAVFALRAIQDRTTPGPQPDGTMLVTTGQLLTPYGLVKRIEGARAKDLALSPDGESVAVLCTNRVMIYSIEGEELGRVNVRTGAVGIAWSPEGTVYCSGDSGQVHVLASVEGKWSAVGNFKPEAPPDAGLAKLGGNPQVNGLAVAGPNEVLIALGRLNGVVRCRVTFEESGVKSAAVAASPTGVAPYRIGAGPRGSFVVLNRGGLPPEEGEASADSSGTRVAVDARTDAASRGSLSLLAPHEEKPFTLATGRQPSGLAVAPDERMFAVANSDSDTVSLYTPPGEKEDRALGLRPPLEPTFGQIPTDLAFSEDGKRLFVTCGGINAVTVIDVATGRLEGHIPTAHFPIAVKRSGNTLVVACSKGFGNRLNGKLTGFGVHDNVGVVQFIKIDEALADLAALTAKVATNNHWGEELAAREGQPPRPVPERVGEPSVFKHVVYIIKENHTYDVTFGDMTEGKGDPRLCLFPEEVTPNQHALARQFVLLDNTYTSGTNSADGHQWTSTAIANGYIEQNYGAHIRSYPYDGGDPLAFSPEGFLWTAATAKDISVRVYGEFVDRPVVRDPATGKAPTFKQLWDAYKAGEDKYEIRAETSQAALRKVLHPRFIGFPSIVSDQWRADQFLAEFREWEKSGAMPRYCILLFPNDHTMGTSPGAPTPRAAVADNDLALGRVVEAISKSKFWKETLILVIEDDSQLGLDHIDGHRTIAQVISPYTKRGTVVSDMYNHTSFIRTMGLVLGFPALTRFDRVATPLTRCFTDTPDFTPFTHVPARIALDELNPPKSQLRGDALKWAAASERLDWSDVDRADADVVARAVWHAQKPNAPFPDRHFRPNRDEDD